MSFVVALAGWCAAADGVPTAQPEAQAEDPLSPTPEPADAPPATAPAPAEAGAAVLAEKGKTGTSRSYLLTSVGSWRKMQMDLTER